MEEVIDQVLATAKAKIDKLSFDHYETEVFSTSPPSLSGKDGMVMCLIGLSGELGELSEPIKKHLFHGKGLDVEALQEEIGDVLWYLTCLNTFLAEYGETGIGMSEVARRNLEKLARRYPNGFQHGGGIR